jgi:hypothetical protein
MRVSVVSGRYGPCCSKLPMGKIAVVAWRICGSVVVLTDIRCSTALPCGQPRKLMVEFLNCRIVGNGFQVIVRRHELATDTRRPRVPRDGQSRHGSFAGRLHVVLDRRSRGKARQAQAAIADLRV